MTCANYKGEMVESPADLYQTVATHADGLLVWSRRGDLQQVRYGLQVDHTTESVTAAKLFGYAVHHFAQCEGLLD